MARSSRDDWPPGGLGGQEALEELARRRFPGGDGRGGRASALHARWRKVMNTLDDGRVFRRTVSPQEFNTFRRRRLDEGITDDQLARSFEIFITAVIHGRQRVLHNDLWRTYSLSWARWAHEAYEPVRRPLSGRRRDPDWQP